MSKDKFDPKSFEEKWRELWKDKQIYKTPEIKEGTDDKAYILDMYPYPSGSGLHVGHPRGYLGTDVVARKERMMGKKVLHPMGFDSFGLPAENYAIKTGTPPKESTDNAIKYFKEQIDALGMSYDWSRELASHTPEFYVWTQKLFLKLYEKGMAYQKEAAVNWCPVDQTVLANEQVEADGTCERCGTEVIQKNLKQWFFKITDYADRLIDDLEKIDWPESTKAGQRNWIGRSEGAQIKFKIQNSKSEAIHDVEVFTTRADTIFSAAFIVIAPEHSIINDLKSNIENWDEVERYINETGKKTELERQQIKEKTGVEVIGIKAINPANSEEIPIYLGDFVLAGYGTGIIFGDVHDERDFEFVKKFNISAKASIVPKGDDDILKQKVINLEECFTDYGVLIESGEFTGMSSEDAKPAITKWLAEREQGEQVVNYRLRDWLVSRQRYWGCPIPIVYDPEGNAHPVSEEHLPLHLPTDVDYNPKGKSPVASSKSFVELAEKLYGKGWRFETDTLDTFVDSTWYFFRFPDVHNEKEFASSERMNAWMPVDLYVGGAEHTVLHLMYARFFTKFLFDEGIINFEEPFQKLRHPGMVLAEDSRKMSKRWGNTIDPITEIEKFGADTLRAYEMFMGPFNSTMPWDTKAETGVFRFLSKVWDQQDKVVEGAKNLDSQEVQIQKTIKKVTEDIDSMSFNTAIAKMMEFTNFIQKEDEIEKSVWKRFLQILAPFTPYITEELWSRQGYEFSIHLSDWPEYDESMTVDDVVEIGVQVNGKMRGTISVSPDADEATAMSAAKEVENIMSHIGDSDPKKVIYVPGRILNVIV